MSTVQEIKVPIDQLPLAERAGLIADLCGWTDDDWDLRKQADARFGTFAVLNERMRPTFNTHLTHGTCLSKVPGMSTASIRPSKPAPRKPRARTKGRAVNKGPSFGEWARRVAGIVKSGERDLSTREGFGD